MANTIFKKTKSYLSLLSECFYSSELYTEYIENEKISPIKILAFSSLISALFISLNIFFVVNNINFDNPQDDIARVIEQFPEIKIIDGNLYSNVKQPYYINLPNKKSFLVIDGFKMKGDSRESLPENLKKNSETDHVIYLGKTEYSYKIGKDVPYSFSYDKNMNNLSFDGSSLKKVILNIKSKILKYLTVFSVMFMIFYNGNIILKAIFFAFLANLYLRKSYKKLIKLLILAFIPPAMIKVIYIIWPKIFIFPEIFFPFISFFYVFFALSLYRNYLRKKTRVEK